MKHGYMGKLLRIDLSTKQIEIEEVEEDVARKYIGGSGLGAKILFEETSVDTDPLGPENILIFMTGPLTGTRTFSSDRFEVITKSPLTGTYAESNCGGHWGEKLKKSGYDGIIVLGKADRPLYIWVDDGQVRLKDASHLWGKDTFEVDEIIKKETTDTAIVVSIGQSGEKLVRIAAIMTDGKHGRAAARCGVGAVMGSKNLKAIAVTGSAKVKVAYPDKLLDLTKEITPQMKSGTLGLSEFGTSNGVVYSENIGNLPIKNWRQGKWEKGAEKITGQTIAETILTRKYRCGRCIIGCGRVIKVAQGPYQGLETGGLEYETLGMLGSNCLIDDLPAIAKANELCNRYGLDTISTGGVIAFAMEAYERGLINKKDTGGVELKWGDASALIEMVHQIGQGRGFGKLLGQGVKRAAEEIGGNAKEFAIHVKGLEFPAHDPRAKFGVALGFATSNRGACHLQAFTHDFEDGASLPDLGCPETLGRFTTKGKAEFVAKMQNLMSMFDSLICCKFVLFGGVTVEPLAKYLNFVTGWDMNVSEFLRTGERIFNLKRLYNVRCGISRKDDSLPPRILTHKRGGGTNHLPPLNIMLNDYYKYRKWDEFGIPTEEKLKELGLDEF